MIRPRVNQAVHALIIQLADVEADFQLEKRLHLIEKTLRHMDNFSTALDMLNMFIDFAVNIAPLLDGPKEGQGKKCSPGRPPGPGLGQGRP